MQNGEKEAGGLHSLSLSRSLSHRERQSYELGVSELRGRMVLSHQSHAFQPQWTDTEMQRYRRGHRTLSKTQGAYDTPKSFLVQRRPCRESRFAGWVEDMLVLCLLVYFICTGCSQS
jgi:hypothetical protein